MAELTITLGRHIESGRLEIRVGLRSDADALPSEHEQAHRRLVQTLLPQAAAGEQDDELLEVRREKPLCEPVIG
jgi:hypothetical protein